MGPVESPGAPQWGDFRAEQLREWFARTPFYAGSPLARVEWRGDKAEGWYALIDALDRVCCTMSAAEMRKAVAS